MASFTTPLQVKMTCKDDIRRFKLACDTALAEDARAKTLLQSLLAKASSAYAIDAARLRLQYTDDEGDLVTIATVEDLVCALENMPAVAAPLRVNVSEKQQQSNTTTAPAQATTTTPTTAPAMVHLVGISEKKMTKNNKKMLLNRVPEMIKKMLRHGHPHRHHPAERPLPEGVRQALNELPQDLQPRVQSLRPFLRQRWAALEAASNSADKAELPQLQALVRRDLVQLLGADQSAPLLKAIISALHKEAGQTSSTTVSPSSSKAATNNAALPTELAAFKTELDSLDGTAQELRETLRQAVLASWPPAPVAVAEGTSKTLPVAVRQALRAIGQPAAQQRMRLALRSAWFGEPIPAEPATGELKKQEKQRPEDFLQPEELKAVKKALKELVPSKELRKPLKQAVLASWPPTAAENLPAGPKMLPELIRKALSAIDQPAQHRLRMALRAAWFSEPLADGECHPFAAAAGAFRASLGGPFLIPSAVHNAVKEMPHAERKELMQALRKELKQADSTDELPPAVVELLSKAPITDADQVIAALATHRKEHGDQTHVRPIGVRCKGHPRFCPERRKWLARFVQHVTVPDEAQVLVGADFTKTWKIRNDAAEAWPVDSVLMCVSGEAGEPLCVAPAPADVELAPGETTDLSVKLMAPTKPGLYEAYYRLREPTGKKFGQRFRVAVMVMDNASAEAAVVVQKAQSVADDASAEAAVVVQKAQSVADDTVKTGNDTEEEYQKIENDAKASDDDDMGFVKA